MPTVNLKETQYVKKRNTSEKEALDERYATRSDALAAPVVYDSR